MKRGFAVGMLGGVSVCVVLSVIAGVVGAQGKDDSTPPALTPSASTSTPISSTFTYQGQLKSNGNPSTAHAIFSLAYGMRPASGHTLASHRP